jgi:hypothetical protein
MDYCIGIGLTFCRLELLVRFLILTFSLVLTSKYILDLLGRSKPEMYCVISPKLSL